MVINSGRSRSRTQYGFPYQLISNQRSHPDEFIFHCDPTEIRTPIPPLEEACPIQLDDKARFCTLNKSRTCNLSLRRRVLYPVELWVHIVAIEGIEPTSHGYEPSVITIIRYRHFAHPLGFEPRTYRLTLLVWTYLSYLADCSTAELWVNLLLINNYNTPFIVIF